MKDRKKWKKRRKPRSPEAQKAADAFLTKKDDPNEELTSFQERMQSGGTDPDKAEDKK